MTTRLRVLLVFGTRPEAIKMAPVIRACRRQTERIEPIVCSAGQHGQMLDQVINWFGIQVDDQLEVMVADQPLTELTARCLQAIGEVLVRRRPHCVVAQGDTTTAMAAALAAFYRQLPFVHVEAGLRTGDLAAPWPEELNRRLADLVAALCCAPTSRAAEVLQAEGVPLQRIRITGNTIVDALLETLQRVQSDEEAWKRKYPLLQKKRLALITGHRRENLGQRLENICRAVRLLADRFPDCQFVYPVHLNPQVQKSVVRYLGGRANIQLIPPLPYPDFVWLMSQAALILTDSGGVQEEAPTLNRPVLLLRETTERPEAIEAGTVRLVGTSTETILEEAANLLEYPPHPASREGIENPFGDGQAASRIIAWVLEQRWS